MRMWDIDPKLLCRKHLLGEHVEMHMFVGTINKNKSVSGYLEKGLVEIHNIKNRHELLSAEMVKRGYNHKSPLPEFKAWEAGKVDIQANLIDLAGRCEECRGRIENHG